MNHPEDSIAERIFHFIRENHLSAGDKLPTEKELAAMFGTSRVVVREGLQGLKFLGILESSTRGGTIIREVNFPLLSRSIQFQIAINSVDWNQLTDARLAIELGVLDTLCGKLSQEQLHALRKAQSAPGPAIRRKNFDMPLNRIRISIICCSNTAEIRSCWHTRNCWNASLTDIGFLEKSRNPSKSQGTISKYSPRSKREILNSHAEPCEDI